jgi:hypothetical protein
MRDGGQPPAKPPGGGPSVQGGESNARLDRMFAEHTTQVDFRQRASVRRWQGRGRYYEQVQRAAQDVPNASDDALQVMNDLQDVARPLPEDVQVWRGVRSVKESFGLGLIDF